MTDVARGFSPSGAIVAQGFPRLRAKRFGGRAVALAKAGSPAPEKTTVWRDVLRSEHLTTTG